MDYVMVGKMDLLSTLKKNLKEHKKIYLEATEGYRVKVIEKLKDALDKAESGEEMITYINIPEPVDNSKDYEGVIAMLKNECGYRN